VAQQRGELGDSQLCGCSRGGGGGEQGPRLGTQQTAAFVGDRLQQGGVVLAQQRAQLVVRAGALPEGVLLGPGEQAMAWVSSESAGRGRWAAMSVRRMWASTKASPASDFLRDTECHPDSGTPPSG
jgi:hypothetical protein